MRTGRRAADATEPSRSARTASRDRAARRPGRVPASAGDTTNDTSGVVEATTNVVGPATTSSTSRTLGIVGMVVDEPGDERGRGDGEQCRDGGNGDVEDGGWLAASLVATRWAYAYRSSSMTWKNTSTVAHTAGAPPNPAGEAGDHGRR